MEIIKSIKSIFQTPITPEQAQAARACAASELWEAEKVYAAASTAENWDVVARATVAHEQALTIARQADAAALIGAEAEQERVQRAALNRYRELQNLCSPAALNTAMAPHVDRLLALEKEADGVINKMLALVDTQIAGAREAAALARDLGLPASEVPVFAHEGTARGQTGRALFQALQSECRKTKAAEWLRPAAG